ncbi:uncharacterized protein C11orf97 homolog isoform X4 [Canis lupus familiaris]|uniref:uncharacterized protein C11orf97 homolog isoform X4 n=1 Tax=Canis lupus familiaris TaxID=9615 RepID=UPI0018F6624D|nr:uncharacterized protein C11orf97 homolog isoform X4 [Canis lupus familiaris]
MPGRCRGDALESAGGGRARGRYGNRDAGRSQADRPAGRRPRLRSGPRGMRRAEAAVVLAGAAREAGREGEQPGQRGGGPQQSCGQGAVALPGRWVRAPGRVCVFERDTGTQKQAPRREPHAGRDPRTPGSRPGPKTGAQPPSPPGPPFHGLLLHSPCALQVYRKKFLYSEPHKRIKEVLEEELYIKRDECHIKNPPAVALERIWSIKRNLPVGNLKPELPSRNSLLPQTTYYSRHGGLRR